jgi:hypothetical protein
MKPNRRENAIALLRRVGPVLHPVLFAAFPLLSLFAHNQSEVELGVLWRPLAVCIAAGAALYGLFVLIFKRGAKAGALASLVVLAFFYFGIFSARVSGWGLSEWWFFAVWIALFVLGALALVRARGELGNLTLILSAGAAVLILGPVVRIAVYQANHPLVASSDSRLWSTALQKPVQVRAARLPDIYFVIPDDYARPDVLKHYFHYNDAGFLRRLRQRGFVVSDQARSPYSDSEMNIAAALNMDYLGGLARILGKNSQDVRPVRRLIADNRASRLLKSLGYRYVHLDTDEVTFPVGNPHISPLAAPDSFPNLWLRNSVLRLLGGTLGFNASATGERFRKSIRSMFSRLAAVPGDPGPKFVVFHTLLPHDPYIYGAEGQPVTFPDSSDQAPGSKLGMRYYLAQLRFLNRKLLEAVDAILAQSKAPPVIVIQSDEGFQANPEPFGEAAMQQIRVKGLIALHLPGVGGMRVPQPPNTVNTLRFVFNRYFGTHYGLLRSASYPELDLPYQFEEMRVK